MPNQEPVWILPTGYEIPESLTELGLPRLALELLYRRGYQNRQAIEKFLTPSLANLHNPKLLPDMEKAVARILLARQRLEKILIYGDYDVDGICGTALLFRTLKKIGCSVNYYIPHRILEGYGISETGVKHAKDHGFKLIVTTDCGTTDFTAIEMANRLGIDVIVTDHHEPKEKLPDAYALINPKRLDTDYPFRELAGVGVSFKLAWALLSAAGGSKEDLVSDLDLVALGTVADIAPLVDENRTLAKFGMLKIKNTDKVGLRSLLKITGLLGKPITPYDIGFILGPRLNAGGRIAQATKAVELLLTEDEQSAEATSRELDLANQERQKIEETIFAQATERILATDWTRRKFFVLADTTWHEGVVGIVASRIVEQFYRPTILLAIKDDIAKGSGRSIPGFDLYQALKSCAKTLIRFGGHKYAAGLLLSREKIGQFSVEIEEYTAKNTTPDHFLPKLFVDARANLKDFDEVFLKILKQFEPFGPENPVPIFVTTGLEVVGYPKVVGKEHLRFKVRQNKKDVVDAIAFGKSEAILKLVKGQPDHLDIVYSIERNNFAGKTKLQLNIKDMRIRPVQF